MTRLFAIVMLLLAAPSTAMAQSGPKAIAAVQAPEAGTGICLDSNADTAIACARQQCMEESGLGEQDCSLNALCSPAGWTADIFQQHQEGLHWHTFTCGWQTRAQAEAAAAITCISEWLIECDVVRLWSPEGEEMTPDGMSLTGD